MTLTAIISISLAAPSTAAWAQSCPTFPYYSPDFTSNQSCLTLNGNATFPTPAGSPATIKSWSGTNGVVTFQASNSFTAGEVIILSGFATSTFFNGLAFPVLKTGLTHSQFEITFSGYTGSTDKGTATPLKVLQLTANRTNQAGSAWYNPQQPVVNGFSSTFTFQLSATSTYNADGIAFVIQNSTEVNSKTGNPTALGPDGCGIGFGDTVSGCTPHTGGIPNSLAVEFNTYLNSGVDKSGNSVSIQSNGTNPNCVDSTCTLSGGLNYNLPVTLADGNIHTVQVSYALVPTPTETSCVVDGNPGPCLDVIIDGHDLFPAGVAVNLGTLLSLNNNDNAWIGFTGATGGGDDIQDILSWTYSTTAQSQSGTVTTTAPTVYNYDGGYTNNQNGGNDYTAQLNSGTSTTTVVTEIPVVGPLGTPASSQEACNALVQANSNFSTAECFVYQNGGGPGIDASVMYEVTCPGSPTGGTCGSSLEPTFNAALGTDFYFTYPENSPLSLYYFSGLPNLTSSTNLPEVGFLKGEGPDPLHPCTPYPGNTPPLFQSNQIFSFTLGDTSGSTKGKGGGTASCWLATYYTPGEVPAVNIVAPVNNATYQQNEQDATTVANYSCSAVNNGTNATGPYLTVASCNGPVASGSYFPTSTLGPNTFTVTVTDSALNTNSSTVTYNVQGSQTITFPPIPTQTFGAAPITLTATATSGLPVTYSATTGPAMVSGSILTITGAGNVTVQATQPGNAEYSAAMPVSQSFTVSSQTPSVNVTNVMPAAEVYGSGTSTAVTATLSWTGGVTAPTGGITFSSTAAGIFGTTTCTGTSSPITCTNSFTPTATDGASSYTISAHYAGDSNYAAATSAQANNFSITAAPLIVTATSAVGTYGLPLPPLMYQVSGFVNGDTQGSATTGAPSEGTSASPSSTPGMYVISISQGSLTSANYTFMFVNGTLTLQQASTTVAVASLDGSIYPNQSTTLTATVTFAGSGAAPTGTAALWLNYTGPGTGTLLGSTGALSPLDATDSSATFTLNGSQLAAGANTITAIYSGDVNYGGSISSSITVTLLNSQVNFGSVNVGTAAPVQTLTYNFSSATTLSAVNILTTGAAGLDYTDGGSSTCTATSYNAGDTCTVTVAFTPSAPGLRSGGLSLFAQGSTLPLMTWYLNGVGQSSAVTIDPGMQSTIATLNNNGQAYGAVIDAAGNVYVVDNANSLVLKLAAGSHTQSTVVGSGLLNPTGVALDGAGNLYISDTGNNRVEVVPNEQGTLNSGDMSTVNISGLGSPLGLATDGSGNLYVADGTNGNVLGVPAGGGSPAIVASGLTGPYGVAVDAAGDVYVSSSNQVSEYPSGGGAPTTIGTGYNNPRGIAVDASGAVYVADTGNSRVVRVAPGGASQTIISVAGLTTPQDVALDAAGNLYVTDPGYVLQINRVQAAALAFASTNVDSTSAPQTLTISDAGNQQLTISNLAITTYFTQTPSGGTDCSSSTQLASGLQCLVAVQFAPTVSGPLMGTFMLTDNALNNPASAQTVQLSGTGTLVTQTINFSPIANQTYGMAPITLSATDSSNMPVTFSVTAGPASVSGSMLTITATGSVTVQASQAGNVEYAPVMASQTFTVNPAPLTVTANNQSMNYGGTVPTFTVSYSGFVNGDTSASLGGTLVCTSTGGSSSPAGNYPITCSGQTSSNYAINYQPGTLAIGKTGTSTSVVSSSNPSVFGRSVMFTASITPASGSSSSETGTVAWSANTGCGATAVTSGVATCTTSSLPVGSDAITAAYSGDTSHTGSSGGLTQTVNQLPAFTSANTVTFGSGVAGSFTITATGVPTPVITESGALPSGLVFTGGTGTATLSGTTTAVGTYSISFIANNAAGTVTQSFTLVVSGPIANVSPTSINFGTVKCYSSAKSTVTLTNTGNGLLKITSVALVLGKGTDNDDFSIKNGCSSSLAAGQFCSIAVTYSPDDAGTQNATLVITDNAPGSPQSVSITGTNTCKAEHD